MGELNPTVAAVGGKRFVLGAWINVTVMQSATTTNASTTSTRRVPINACGQRRRFCLVVVHRKAACDDSGTTKCTHCGPNKLTWTARLRHRLVARLRWYLSKYREDRMKIGVMR